MVRNETRYCCAVWWPREQEYGGVSSFATEQQALDEKSRTEKMDYLPDDVHVWKVQVTRIFPAK